ncbi:glycoside hydrolase family 3 [bacterium (Candidatus Gribaldobacteria) CG08_land_8_20_14_0_20_39_15]|uniref:beta-N-acetylhexosaminidase n=1 Tax=bacterium (Candidatus Gribaldobacteria) CG08_land_8_20_14_0_20_39_15 TaxID=2014273 RepID=A0A2M6XTW3_9BACT|nr:MAG: glycoside hydrolase family 3 [bacterium (Candidatus Gribaldobacteria) CG08_land_8_20_14_0_20_39_15]
MQGSDPSKTACKIKRGLTPANLTPAVKKALPKPVSPNKIKNTMNFKLFLKKNFRNVLTVSAFVVVAAAGYFLSPVLNNKEKPPQTNQLPLAVVGDSQVPDENSSADVQLKEKIGQMLIVGFRGVDFSEQSFIGKALADLKPGGIVLFDFDVPSQAFPRNIVNAAQTKKLIVDLQSHSDIPLFVAVDVEGGMVNRLKPEYGFMAIPSAQQMGKQSIQQTEEIARNLGQELFDLGFNFDFAPVVDVNVNPQNPIIAKLGRSFSSQPQKVIEQAAAFIKGLEQYKIITSIKHFPGHGSSQADSHNGVTDITESYKSPELWPFQELFKSGLAKTVMVGHLVNKNIDPEFPATFSNIFIGQILKQNLGFQGLVVCDDLQMAAISQNYTLEQSAVKMVSAGCDLLIISNNVQTYDETAPYRGRDAILEAIRNKAISEDSINNSFVKIQALKKEVGIIK